VGYNDDQQTTRYFYLYFFLGVVAVAVCIAAIVRFVQDANAREVEAREASVRACIESGHAPADCRPATTTKVDH